MTSPNDAVVECQDCGSVLRTLSPVEAQQVADNPYNFILLCAPCKREEDQIMEARHVY